MEVRKSLVLALIGMVLRSGLASFGGKGFHVELACSVLLFP